MKEQEEHTSAFEEEGQDALQASENRLKKETETADTPVAETPAEQAEPKAEEISSLTEPSMAEETAEAETAEEPAKAEETEQTEETADGEQTKAASALPAPVEWKFGESAPIPPRKVSKKHFYIAFASIFAVCMLLLAGTFFLGKSGIQIVKTVNHERVVYVREYDPASGLLTPHEAADIVKKSTVTVSVRNESGAGIGTGFIYSADGYICTNYHVVEHVDTIQVTLADGETADATLVGVDELADLAVIKIDKTGLTPVTPGSSADLLVGDDVVAIGSPAKVDYAGTATFGKISATNRIVALTDEKGMINKKMTLIQTDASVNPGNSGGPLVDMYGHVVGVVVMKVSYFGGTIFDGIGFAIPMDGAKVIVDAIIAHGSFTGKNPVAESRSVIGISGRGLYGEFWYSDPSAESVTQSKTEKEGYVYAPVDGIYVTDVTGSNALGKLQKGDFITHIEGMRMYSVVDIVNQVNRYHIGETVTVRFLRLVDGVYQEKEISLLLCAE